MPQVTRRYLLLRVVQIVPTILGIVLISFVLVQAAPGDPVLALAGEHGDQAYYREMRRHFALDRPLPERFGIYVSRLATGDLGMSRIQGRPVAVIIAERIPATLLLTVSALLCSSLAGLLLGIVATLRRDGAVDLVTDMVTLGLHAAPVFWVGQISILVLAAGLGIFPVFGMRSTEPQAGGLPAAFDVLVHLALPALVLTSQQLAGVARVTRQTLGRELDRDYVRAALAKGLPRGYVVVRHALRLALLPVVTLVGHRMGYLLGGAVVVETIFGWPGLGTLLLSSLQSRDAPVVLGIFLLAAGAVVVANLVTDLTYGALDPRVRHG